MSDTQKTIKAKSKFLSKANKTLDYYADPPVPIVSMGIDVNKGVK